MTDRLGEQGIELEGLVGRAGPFRLAVDAVSRPMIRQFAEAMGDTNPIYVSDEAARSFGHEAVVAPPAMLTAWILPGLGAVSADDAGDPDPPDVMAGLLRSEGLTASCVTECTQHYGRSLVPGDRLLTRTFIESISDPTEAPAGTGRFVTARLDFVAAPDTEVAETPSPADLAALAAGADPVATMRLETFHYLPSAGAGAGPAGPPGANEEVRPLRPRPAVTPDNAFWFEGTRAHKLLLQRCTSCGTLRHPPLPACGVCQALEWDTVEASGRGVLYSFVVVHYPQVAPFEYPHPVALVELEEGTRLVAEIDGLDPGELRIGLALRATFVDYDEELSLPVFVPDQAASSSRDRGAT
jgi:uncharacterized OB-fold protein